MRPAVPLAALLLAIAPPAPAAERDERAQLEASVQHRLDRAGFEHVDAAALSTRQLAALHMELRSGRLRFGLSRLDTRSRIEVILGWD